MDIKKLEILGIMLATLTPITLYLIGSRSKLNLNKLNSKNERINSVVKQYIVLFQQSKGTDIAALMQAGIATLETEAEALVAIDKITKFQQRNPLISLQSQIEEVGVLRFFQNTSFQQYKLGKLQESLDKLRSNSK